MARMLRISCLLICRIFFPLTVKATCMSQRKNWLVFPLVIFLFSCHKDDNNNSGGSNIDPTGEWHVTLFTDSGQDETSDFDGYLFTFGSSNVLTAKRGAVSTTGTWSKGSDFNIDLGPKSDTNKPLGELTDDWVIISVSSTEIKLKDDNTSSGEFLTFTKN